MPLEFLYYLDDIEPQKSPLRLLPYSHTSLNKNRTYNLEFDEDLEDEIQFTCKAGTAVMFNTKMFHGVKPNKTKMNRRVLALTYRPRFSKPLNHVEEYTDIKLSTLSNELRPYFENING